MGTTIDQPSRSSFLGTAGDWIAENSATLGAFIGPLIFGLGCAWVAIPSEWGKIDWLGSGAGRTIISGAIVTVSACIWQLVKAESSRHLRERAESAEKTRDSIQDAYSEFADQYRAIQQNIIKALLVEIAVNFALGDSDRISLYGHNGKCFFLAGRHSRHPEYAKPGRATYPDDQGCIGEAWRHGTAFVDNLPDPLPNPRLWVRQVGKDWGIPKDAAEAMSMKSRCLVAHALEGSQKDERVAVIVMESDKINRFSAKTLDENIHLVGASLLVGLLKIMATFEPNPEYAKNEGY
jgi:hypothetical protein